MGKEEFILERAKKDRKVEGVKSSSKIGINIRSSVRNT